MVPKLTFQLNLVPKLTFGAEVHRLVPKLICAEVTRAEHRLPPLKHDNQPEADGLEENIRSGIRLRLRTSVLVSRPLYRDDRNTFEFFPSMYCMEWPVFLTKLSPQLILKKLLFKNFGNFDYCSDDFDDE